jgi:hypothetical protein
MSNLVTARTRLGLFGHATRPTGSFLRLPEFVAPELGLFGGYVDAEDAVVTLLATRNARVTLATASDEAVPQFAQADGEFIFATAYDEHVTGAAAFDA